MAFERITVDPDRMGGVPCIRDLRVTVSMVLGQLAGGQTIDEVLGDYPYLEREDILGRLSFEPVGPAPLSAAPRADVAFAP